MQINNLSFREVCTTRDAAEALGVTQRTIQLWVDSGVLRAWKTPGGHMKISLLSVNEIIQKRNESIELQKNDPDKEFTILYVEDDKAQQQLFNSFFSRLESSIKLQFATNGFEGLLNLGRNMPDLLITDLKMPSMDGFEMIKHLQDNKDFAGLNIIVFTSMSMEEIAEKGGLPMDIKVFLKPIQFTKVEEFIKPLISLKRKLAVNN